MPSDSEFPSKGEASTASEPSFELGSGSLPERFAVLSTLFAAGRSDSLLGSLSLTAASAVYWSCMGLMVLAMLRALGISWKRRSRADQTPASDSLQPGLPTTGRTSVGYGGATAWHAPTTFTDPFFQLPAALCAVMALAIFVQEQVAAPPESTAGLWTLAGLTAFVGGTIASILWSRAPTDTPDGAVAASEATGETASEPSGPGAFSDPWFSVPAIVALSLVGARALLEEVEEGTVTRSFGIVLIGVGALVAVFKLSELLRKQKDAKTAASDGTLAAGATGDADDEIGKRRG